MCYAATPVDVDTLGSGVGEDCHESLCRVESRMLEMYSTNTKHTFEVRKLYLYYLFLKATKIDNRMFNFFLLHFFLYFNPRTEMYNKISN